MTDKYKIGDKVLVELEVKSFDGLHYLCERNSVKWFVDEQFMRPYTPRQEFEYGEEVEVKDRKGGRARLGLSR